MYAKYLILFCGNFLKKIKTQFKFEQMHFAVLVPSNQQLP